MARVDVLDVGHGSCAVVVDSKGCVVIDGGTGQTLHQYLRQHGIDTVDAALVSHAELDHFGGLIDVLLDSTVTVRHVYVNPDALRRTRSWETFRFAVGEASAEGRTTVHTELTTTTSAQLRRPEVSILVLAPDSGLALGGVGGQQLGGEAITAHSMCAVIKLAVPQGSALLLAGDADSQALQSLLQHPDGLSAAVLVFPHHGGLSGGAGLTRFVSCLCQAVAPQLVIFSTGRDVHRNPRPEVVQAVRQAVPTAYIACTQLSKDCAASVPAVGAAHLSSAVSRGMASKKCCAGTIRIDLQGAGLTCIPSFEAHAAFVHAHAPGALCLLGSMQVA